MSNIQNENKIMNSKNGLISEYNRNLEKEKKKIASSIQDEISLVQNNFEQMNNFYKQQKLIFQAEQSVSNSSNFIESMQNLLDSKNAIFKSLLEQNYYILNKNMEDIKNLKELEFLTNKDEIIEKIQDILNMSFYSNIYDILYQDLNSEKNLMGKYLEDLIRKCELIISTFNCDKKVQLRTFITHPKFN
jgi:hypothetical protein